MIQPSHVNNGKFTAIKSNYGYSCIFYTVICENSQCAFLSAFKLTMSWKVIRGLVKMKLRNEFNLTEEKIKYNVKVGIRTATTLY